MESCKLLILLQTHTEVEWTIPVLKDFNPDSSLNLSGLPKFAFLCVPEAN